MDRLYLAFTWLDLAITSVLNIDQDELVKSSATTVAHVPTHTLL